MTVETFIPDQDELQSVFDPAIEQFQIPLHTNELAEASLAAFIQGKDGAYFVPAVDFAIGVGLRVCNLPSVRRQLPTEIISRADTAAYVAGQAARIGAKSGLFAKTYRASPYMVGIVNPDQVEELSDPDYMRSLCEPPFFDAAIALGGAVRVLRKHGIDEATAASAATDNRSLQLIAQVRTAQMSQVHRYLGKPYARQHHYDVQVEEGVAASAGFNSRAVAFLRARTDKDSGCPAMNVRPDGNKSIFSQRWQEIAHVLLSNGAEASTNPSEPTRRRITAAAA